MRDVIKPHIFLLDGKWWMRTSIDRWYGDFHHTCKAADRYWSFHN